MGVGSTVRIARESANVSLVELSEKTRLRKSLLVGIERDDFSMCGGNVYARGHLRIIASIIGLDPTAIVAEFDKDHSPISDSTQMSGPVLLTEESRSPAMTWRLLGSVLGVGLVAAFLWLIVPGFHVASTSKAVTSIPEAVVSQVPTTAPSADPTASAVATKTDSVSVIVTSTTGSSWMAVTNSSGGQLFSSMLHRGESKEFTDPQQISLTIGNAGGVELQVNGKNLGSPGGSGQVVHLTFGPGSPTVG